MLLCYYPNMLNTIHTCHYSELRYHEPQLQLYRIYIMACINILSCRDKLDKRAEINN